MSNKNPNKSPYPPVSRQTHAAPTAPPSNGKRECARRVKQMTKA